MPRTTFRLTLAVVAICAASALSVAGAAADSFRFAPVTAISASQSGSSSLVTTAGSANCGSGSFVGASIAAETSEVTVTPTYESCTAFGFPGAVHVNGCTYVLHIGEATSGTADIKCPAGKELTITGLSAGIAKCIVHVKEQSGLGTVSYENLSTVNGPLVVAKFSLTGITYSHTAGEGVGKCTTGSSNSGTFSASILVDVENKNEYGAYVE
jgi:hypothetical protein